MRLAALLPSALLLAPLLAAAHLGPQAPPAPTFGSLADAHAEQLHAAQPDALTVALLAEGRDCQDPDSPRPDAIPAGAILHLDDVARYAPLDAAWTLAGQGWTTLLVCYGDRP